MSDGLRDARGVPYDVVPDGDAVVFIVTRPIRLEVREREAFEVAYKRALTEAEASHDH